MSASQSTLSVFYDLSVSPTSFDFATFLALAEYRRQALGARAFHVYFVPASGDGFWDREPYPTEQKRARLQHLLLPLCGLWPNCEGSTVFARRDDAQAVLPRDPKRRFPIDYRVDAPVEDAYQWAALTAAVLTQGSLPAWRVPEPAAAALAHWLEPRARGRQVVSITLRDGSYYPMQNSNIPAWIEFAKNLDPQRYFPVLIPDTRNAHRHAESVDGVAIYSAASEQIAQRAALYAASALNMTVATGPMLLMWLNPACRTLVFKLLNLDNHQSTPTPIRSMGIEPGHPLVTAAPGQRVVWQNDDADTLAREFEQSIKQIESGEAFAQRANEPLLTTARRMLETGRLAPARRIYAHLLSRNPRDAGALYAMSQLEIKDPSHTKALRAARGVRYFARARLARSSAGDAPLEEALEFGRCHQRLHFAQAAAKGFERVLALDPCQPDALHGLGTLHIAEGRMKDAVETLTRSLDRSPYRADCHFDLARAYRAMGERERARDQLERTLVCDPSHQAAQRVRAEWNET